MRFCKLAFTYFIFWFHHTYSLVQPKEANVKEHATNPKELVFQHVPYNFGHTIEKVAAFGNGMFANMLFGSTFMFNVMKSKVVHGTDYGMNFGNRNYFGNSKHSQIARLDAEFNSLPWMREHRKREHRRHHDMTAKNEMDTKNGFQMWGAIGGDLMQKSSKGCPMYLTPTKFWPPELAEAYYGNKSIFGLIRDPLERLVALFRGSVGGETGDIYGGSYDEWAKTCDVDGAVGAMMKNYIKNRFSDPYSHGCTFLPQTDFVGGKYGITIPVDNRRFPMSFNNLMAKYGYPFKVTNPDILHVTGCEETWAGAVSMETRNLVKMVYKQDYSFICQTFGYCEEYESTCLQHVPKMCPQNMSLATPPLIELPYGFGIYPPEGGIFDIIFPHPNHDDPPPRPPAEESIAWNPDIANPWAEAMRFKPRHRLKAASYTPMNPWAAPAAPWNDKSSELSEYDMSPENEAPPDWFMKPVNKMVAKAISSGDPQALYDFTHAFASKPWAAVPWDEGTLADVEAAREAGLYSWGPGSLT